MKKVFLLAITVVLVMTFAVPAMAKVTIGGIVYVDAFWTHRDADHMQRVVGRANDSSQTRFNLDVPSCSRLFAKWISKEGNVGMHIEFGIDGEASGENVGTRHAFGWWQINDIFKLIVGQTSETFAKLAPTAQLMGGEAAGGNVHVIGYGFGNFGNDREPRVQINAKLTDNFSLDVSAVYMRVNGAQRLPAGVSVLAGTWAAAEEESCMPKFEVLLTAKFGPVTIYPSFMYYKAKYARDAGTSANVWAQDDDEIMAYGWAIPVKFAYGPFSLAAEYVMGENIAAAGGGALTQLTYAWDAQGDTRVVANSEVNAFWIDLGYTISPLASLHFVWGMQDEELDREGLANDMVRESDMWGLALPLRVAPHFTITPNYFVYDWGDQEDGGVNLGGLGKETLVGIQFMVAF